MSRALSGLNAQSSTAFAIQLGQGVHDGPSRLSHEGQAAFDALQALVDMIETRGRVRERLGLQRNVATHQRQALLDTIAGQALSSPRRARGRSALRVATKPAGGRPRSTAPG